MLLVFLGLTLVCLARVGFSACWLACVVLVFFKQLHSRFICTNVGEGGQRTEDGSLRYLRRKCGTKKDN